MARPFTDRDALRNEAYADDAKLSAGVADEVWSAAIELLAARVAAVIAADGAFACTVVKGIFVCR